MNSGHHIRVWRSLGGLTAAVLLFFQFQGCAEVPITHRKGLHLVSETELLSMMMPGRQKIQSYPGILLGYKVFLTRL